MLTEALIDDATWDGASRARRHEWRQALDDLLADHKVAVDDPLRVLVTVDKSRILLDVLTVEGRDYARIELPIARLSERLREYYEICQDMGRLGEGGNSPRLEALDIAKRITHDEAAEELLPLCAALRPDHATCRRLFTLIVALHFDTTRLGHPAPARLL